MNKPKRWNVSLLQMDVKIGEPEENFANLERMLEEAVRFETKPDMILFPEMWNTGYALDRIHDIADREGERTKRFLSEFSRRHQVNIVGGSIADRKDGSVRNTIYVFDRSGSVIADYSKIHLFGLMDEEKYLAAGDRVGRMEIDGIPTGMMICYDIRFPELSRTLALGGAQILFVPAEWPLPRLHHWRTLLMARAIENQMFVAACNRVGISGKTEFFGHSMVIDPWGEVLIEGGEQEAVLNAAIDLSLVDKVRGTIPVFSDRKPDVYR